MADTARLLRQLVIANRILAQQGVVDAFGHVSIRHPEHPDRYVISRSRAPQLVTQDDLQTYELDSAREVNGDQRRPYGERFIHGAIYEARPEVQAVCHNHSPSVIPFGVTGIKMRPIYHMAGVIGGDIPVWDVADEFGDTDLLVVSMAMGRSLAETLGPRRVALMRGHGSVIAGDNIQQVVATGVYMEKNAHLQTLAHIMSGGQVHTLSDGEIGKTAGMMQTPLSAERAWEAWRTQAGFEED